MKLYQTVSVWPSVANRCGIHSECFSHSRPLLAQVLANPSEFSLLCAEVLKYRLEKSKTVVQLSET